MLQPIEQVALAVGLVVEVVGVVAFGMVVVADVVAVPGRRQLAWHDAACELQFIMQVVVVNVCACAAGAPAASIETPNTIATARITASRIARRGAS